MEEKPLSEEVSVWMKSRELAQSVMMMTKRTCDIVHILTSAPFVLLKGLKALSGCEPASTYIFSDFMPTILGHMSRVEVLNTDQLLVSLSAITVVIFICLPNCLL